MSTRIQFILLLICFTGCRLQGQEQGVIVVHLGIFGPNGAEEKQPLKINYRILFKDGKSIQEIPLIMFQKTSSEENTTVKIKLYSYLDPNRNICVNYGNFSDTARALKHFSNIDSVKKNGGWNFYSDEKFRYDSLKKLGDTVVNNIAYSRVLLFKRIGDNVGRLVLYMRCETKGTLIKLFKDLSETIGCPIVRDDDFIGNKLFMTRELEFVADRLSKSELSVFDAWDRNAEMK